MVVFFGTIAPCAYKNIHVLAARAWLDDLASSSGQRQQFVPPPRATTAAGTSVSSSVPAASTPAGITEELYLAEPYLFVLEFPAPRHARDRLPFSNRSSATPRDAPENSAGEEASASEAGTNFVAAPGEEPEVAEVRIKLWGPKWERHPFWGQAHEGGIGIRSRTAAVRPSVLPEANWALVADAVHMVGFFRVSVSVVLVDWLFRFRPYNISMDYGRKQTQNYTPTAPRWH